MSNDELKKASMLNTETDLKPNEKRIPSGDLGLFSLATLNGVIYEEIKKELQAPNNKKLYKQMLRDSSVSTPYDLMRIMVSAPDWKVSCPKGAPEVEKTRAKMLNYAQASTRRPWSEYIVEMMSYMVQGFWVGEKIYEKNFKTPYGVLKKSLKTIKTLSQDTIHQWHFDKTSGEYIGLRQDLNQVVHDYLGQLEGHVDIPRVKYLHLRYLPVRDNPEGDSILNSLYVIWKYKALLEEYLTIGAIKDLSGIPVFYIAAEKLAEAEADPNSNAAKLVSRIQAMGQGLHAGDLQFAMLPVEYDENNNKMYDFQIKGIEGAGKQYDILEIIKYYNNQILIRFFADMLSMGTDGSGSFALSDNKMSLVEMAAENHLKTIKRTLNHDLMRQIYRLNDWDYDPENSCYLEYDKLNDGDLGVWSSAAQKLLAVSAIRPSESLEAVVCDKLDIEPYDESTKFIKTEVSTGVGRGYEEGLPNGVGNSTAKGADRAVANVSGNTV